MPNQLHIPESAMTHPSACTAQADTDSSSPVTTSPSTRRAPKARIKRQRGLTCNQCSHHMPIPNKGMLLLLIVTNQEHPCPHAGCEGTLRPPDAATPTETRRFLRLQELTYIRYMTEDHTAPDAPRSIQLTESGREEVTEFFKFGKPSIDFATALSLQ